MALQNLSLASYYHAQRHNEYERGGRRMPGSDTSGAGGTEEGNSSGLPDCKCIRWSYQSPVSGAEAIAAIITERELAVCAHALVN